MCPLIDGLEDGVDHQAGETVAALLHAVRTEAAHAPGLDTPSYQDALDRFVRALRRVARGIAHSSASRYRLDRTQWADVLLSVVDEQTLLLIQDFVAGSLTGAEAEEFKPLLRHRCRSAVWQYLNSSAGLNVASGQSGQKRRMRELAITASDMMTEGIADPTAEAVVRRTNERLAKTRRDVVRQGMVCTVEDYQALHWPTGNDAFVPAEEINVAAAADGNEDLALYSTEIARAKALTIQRCGQTSERLRDVARCWLDPSMMAPNGEPPDAAQVARALGIGESTARRRLASVREQFRHVVAENYGVTQMYA